MPVSTERFTSRGSRIAADVYVPTTSGRHPAVLVLHGAFGLLPEYRADLVSFAEAVVEADMVAVVPMYLESTGTVAGLSALTTMHEHLPAWRAACDDALLFCSRHSGVNAGRLGAIGFSLGGHLALGMGMTPPAGTSLKCIVDFFGPTSMPALTGSRSALPPVLIHHGTSDRVVPIADSEQLVAQLRGAGKTQGVGYEYITYEGQGHGFSGTTLTEARVRTVELGTRAHRAARASRCRTVACDRQAVGQARPLRDTREC